MRKTVVVALLLAVFALGGALLASAAQTEKKSAAIAQLQKQVGKLTGRVKALERDADSNSAYLENRMDRIEATVSNGICLAKHIADYLARLQAALPAEYRPAGGGLVRVKGGCV
jgi:hypothetical protein